MKLPPFEYAAPATLAEATALLAAHGGDARPLAGGQSLLPVLAFRLAAPSLLVDLRRVPGLDHIRIDAGGTALGARVRWCDIEAHPDLPTAQPLLAAAVACIAHYPIRNRGTIGGSLAHADPAAELPGVAVACDARIAIVGASGERVLPAHDFFLAPLTTALAPDELVVELRLPAWPARRRWAFEEYARQRGAFALAGIALRYDERDGAAADPRIAVIGACDRPQRLAAAEAALDGRAVDASTAAAVADAAAGEVDPPQDPDATPEYRRALVRTLVARALATAAARDRVPGGRA